MIVLEDLVNGTKKVYNCCDRRAIQIIADRANTGRIEMLKAQIAEVEKNERNNTTRNAIESTH